MTILSGATLVILRSPEERTGSKFIDTMNQFCITVITLPPSLLAFIDPDATPRLRKIISAGEVCPTALAQKWYAHGRKFYNAYGPSEAAICTTIHEYETDVNETLPIGTPIDNLRTRIVDEELADVPVGMPGELLLSGIGVSQRGYLNNLIHEMNNPFLTIDGNIWYRTGDLVTNIDPKRNLLIYVGRKDSQVKLRGCRIELGEIEMSILSCPGICHCVVVLHHCDKCKNSNPMLIAYADGTTTVTTVQEHIIQKLPSYMLPTCIIIKSTADLPKNISGKIDRHKLARDVKVHDESNQPYNMTIVEERIFFLWSKLLKKSHTNLKCKNITNLTFSQYGGDSLTVALLNIELVKEFSVDIRIHSHMTLKQMANILIEKTDALENISRQFILADLNESIIEINRKMTTSICSSKDLRSILITGVTGFLGCFLFYDLLKNTSLHIFVLVRAKSKGEAIQRLCNTFEKYELNGYTMETLLQESESKRLVICLCNDLSEAKKSFHDVIQEDQWETIDAVLHCAADTNFTMSYENLRIVNVNFTKYLLENCIKAHKPFYFVSSLSIFLFTNDRGSSLSPIVKETDEPHLDSIVGGYSQSKYVADQLVFNALCKGLPGIIFRPGRITGSSLSGIGCNDLFTLMIRGCSQLGGYPKLNFPFDMTPVDMVSKSIIHAIVHSFHKTTRVVHLINTSTIPFYKQFHLLQQQLDSTKVLDELPYETWLERLSNPISIQQQEKTKEFNVLLPLLPFLRSSFWQHVDRWPVFERTTNQDLATDHCPETLFQIYYSAWKRERIF